jgi:hypothetical protein
MEIADIAQPEFTKGFFQLLKRLFPHFRSILGHFVPIHLECNTNSFTRIHLGFNSP